MQALCIRWIEPKRENLSNFHMKLFFHVYLIQYMATYIYTSMLWINIEWCYGVCTRRVRFANEFSNSALLLLSFVSLLLVFSPIFLGMLHVSFDMLINRARYAHAKPRYDASRMLCRAFGSGCCCYCCFECLVSEWSKVWWKASLFRLSGYWKMQWMSAYITVKAKHGHITTWGIRPSGKAYGGVNCSTHTRSLIQSMRWREISFGSWEMGPKQCIHTFASIMYRILRHTHGTCNCIQSMEQGERSAYTSPARSLVRSFGMCLWLDFVNVHTHCNVEFIRSSASFFCVLLLLYELENHFQCSSNG